MLPETSGDHDEAQAVAILIIAECFGDIEFLTAEEGAAAVDISTRVCEVGRLARESERALVAGGLA